jgi:YD repeat-containing protein
VTHIEEVTVNEDPINVVTPKPIDINPMSFMGTGWSLKFDRIIFEGEDKYLRFANGGMHKIEGTTLKNYLLSGMRFDSDSGTFGNTAAGYSRYKLTFANGSSEFFDDKGILMAQRDRFGNTITFLRENSVSPYKSQLRITDSKGSVILIKSNDSEAVFVMPDNSTVTYYFKVVPSRQIPDNKYLSLDRKVDQENLVTSYRYSTASFTGTDPLTTNYWNTNYAENVFSHVLPLTKITFPDTSATVYSYGGTIAHIGYIINGPGGSYGYREVMRIEERNDLISGEEVNNRTYEYTEMSYTGYPDEPNLEELGASFNYGVTVSDLGRNTSVAYTFNNKHSRSRSVTKLNGSTKQSVTNTYNSLNLPEKTVTTLYNRPVSSTSRTITELYEYNNYGNVTAYWSPLANGSKSNTDYKTTMTYHATYQIPLTKTYKQNASTTIVERNTLANSNKSIGQTQILVNNVEKTRTVFSSFDSYGNVLERRDYLDGSNYIPTTFVYENGALPTKTTIGTGTSAVSASVSYDTGGMGYVASTTDGNGNKTSFTYDKKGRVLTQTNPDGTSSSNAYDTVWNTVTSYDGNGVMSMYTYNAFGLLLTAELGDSSHAVVKNEYDSALRLLRSTDANGNVTNYTYDALDRVLTMTAPLQYKETYVYEDAVNSSESRVTKTVAGSGNAPTLKSSTYSNIVGLVTKETLYPNGTENTTYANTYQYDFLGNKTQERSAGDAEAGRSFTAKYEYNYAGLVTKLTDGLNNLYTTEYDWLGRKTGATDPKGSKSLFSYDSQGRLTLEQIPFVGGYYTKKNYECVKQEVTDFRYVPY